MIKNISTIAVLLVCTINFGYTFDKPQIGKFTPNWDYIDDIEVWGDKVFVKGPNDTKWWLYQSSDQDEFKNILSTILTAKTTSLRVRLYYIGPKVSGSYHGFSGIHID